MNDTQTVFSVFFAIFWGVIANVQPKWKMFDWTQIATPCGRSRLFLAVLLFNVCPLVFFGYTIWMLIGVGVPSENWNIRIVVKLLCRGVLPAASLFGFYKLWISIMEKWPDCFYEANVKQEPAVITNVELKSKGKPWINFLVAMFYLAIAFAGPLYFRRP